MLIQTLYPKVQLHNIIERRSLLDNDYDFFCSSYVFNSKILGKFAIRNKKHGLYLTFKKGRLELTENRLGKNSEWLWKSGTDNKIWGAIIPATNSEMGLSGWIKDDKWKGGTIRVSLFSLCKYICTFDLQKHSKMSNN